MYEVQWPIIEKALKKIDYIAEKVNISRLDVQQIKDAINGNGSIGIKDQLKDIRKKLENKAEKIEVEILEKKIANKKKSSTDWIKSIIPWLIAITAIVVTWLKT